MRSRGWSGAVLGSLVGTVGLVASVASAQSPAPSVVPPAPCGTATTLRFPIHDAGAVLVTPFAFEDAALANPDSRFTGRFQPDEAWVLPDAPDHRAVFAAGPGIVVASGPIASGDQGGIVVVEHTGPFMLPASGAGDRFVLDVEPAASLLTVYAGIDPTVSVGTCVSSDSLVGITTAACQDGGGLPCSDLPAGLRFGVRLMETADPAMRSADWSVAGPADHSIGGTFLDPQVMVDDGVRPPSRVLIALAEPCPSPTADPAASAGPGQSPVPCGPAVPGGSPAPSASPLPTPSPVPPATASPPPTPRPVVAARRALLQGIPADIQDTCEPRTSRLVTGTLAAVDCRPDDPAIEQLTYFLGRPADARFTFASRADEQGLSGGGDCAASLAGVESRKRALSVLCYRDEDGRANVRYVISDSCPAVYIGALGTGKDIGALVAALGRSTGDVPWTEPAGTVAVCRGDDGKVSAPPAPTDARFKSVISRQPTAADPLPPTRITVSWTEPVTADTRIEIWGIKACLRKPPKNGTVPCVDATTRIPADELVLLRTAPASAGSVSWLVPTQEIMGGDAYYDEEHGSMASVVIRAVNDRARSRFVILPEARGVGCDDCVY